MAMLVQVSITYNRTCSRCTTKVVQEVNEMVSNPHVSGIALKHVPRCEHESGSDLTDRLRNPKPEPTPLRGVAAAQPMPGQASLLTESRSPYGSADGRVS